MAEVAASSSDYGTLFDRLTRLCCGLTLAFAIMRETYENERVCCAGRLQAIGNDGAGRAESKSQCSHRPLLLRSLPPVIVPNGIPAVPVSGFNAKIPMTENCANFAFPLYRDRKTARVLLSR